MPLLSSRTPQLAKVNGTHVDQALGTGDQEWEVDDETEGLVRIKCGLVGLGS